MPPPAAGVDVSVRAVGKTYDGRVRALRDVDLEVAAGEFVVVTGPSGCGKSTLLNLIGALDRPDHGEIAVGGDVLGEAVDLALFRRRMVGFVFQLHHLLGQLTARENVEVPLIAAGVHGSERRRRALDLLAEVGLAERSDHVPSQLSGGERQRVAVARALVNGPRLLLADEPTGALDSASSEQVLALLARTRERHGMTVLMASYDPAAGASADRVVRMRDGAIVGEERRVEPVRPVPVPVPETAA